VPDLAFAKETPAFGVATARGNAMRPLPIVSRAVLACAVLAGPAAAPAQEMLDATATLNFADGELAGSANIRQLPAGLLIEVNVTGFTPGAHGIHIHETGACTPDFDAAGEHFAPEGHGHGFAATDTPHPGDLPNLIVGDDGVGDAAYLNARATLSEGAAALMDDDGAALIIHEGTDDYGSEADVAGARIACGVIEAGG
jgi:superoxide dismutase, Cu-Zn family